jgi:glycosyltransferase involved in cell wall biosynthesis
MNTGVMSSVQTGFCGDHNMNIGALAILCVRNEILHIERALRQLIEDELEVCVIDNASSDGTREVVEAFVGRGVIMIVDLPWTGAFSLSDQLRAKSQVVENSLHDWILHVDADEWLQTPKSGQTLLQGIIEAESEGANCINFNEFVFIPLDGADFAALGYHEKMTDYYFFQPNYPRLMRGWRRSAALSNNNTGGHILQGSNINKYKIDFHLRHYICLSENQAKNKYVDRRFSEEDLNRGWHGNRINIDPCQLVPKRNEHVFKLLSPLSRDFNTSRPTHRHFWQW